MCRFCRNAGSLNILQTQAPVQGHLPHLALRLGPSRRMHLLPFAPARNITALPLFLTIIFFCELSLYQCSVLFINQHALEQKPINDLNTQTDNNGPKIRKKKVGLAYKNILQFIQFERIRHLSEATQRHPRKYES